MFFLDWFCLTKFFCFDLLVCFYCRLLLDIIDFSLESGYDYLFEDTSDKLGTVFIFLTFKQINFLVCLLSYSSY